MRSHFLMDAGDLGSRNLTVTWVDVPPGPSSARTPTGRRTGLRGRARQGRMQVAGDAEQVGEEISSSSRRRPARDRQRRLRAARLRLRRLAAGLDGRARTTPSSLHGAGYDDDEDTPTCSARFATRRQLCSGLHRYGLPLTVIRRRR